MADKEIIAAILAAGMLPSLTVPDLDPNGGLQQHDQERLIRAIQHAVGLYRGILEGLAIPPASMNGGASKDPHFRLTAAQAAPQPAHPNR